jgi:hypothetical protein
MTTLPYYNTDVGHTRADGGTELRLHRALTWAISGQGFFRPPGKILVPKVLTPGDVPL